MTRRRLFAVPVPGPVLLSVPGVVFALVLLAGCTTGPTGAGGLVVDKQTAADRCLLYVEHSDDSGQPFHVEVQVDCETHAETNLGDVLRTTGDETSTAAACAYRDTPSTWRTVSKHDCAEVADLRRLTERR